MGTSQTPSTRCARPSGRDAYACDVCILKRVREGIGLEKRNVLMTRGRTLGLVFVVVIGGLLLSWGHRPAPDQRLQHWMAALNAIALTATLIVIWWYSEETARLRVSADETFRLSLEAHVVIRRRRTVSQTPTGTHAGWDYVAANIGPGAARRVVHFTEKSKYSTVSALGANHELRLRDRLIDDLNREMKGETQTHCLLAEGLDGRWYRSVNVVDGDGEIACTSAAYVPPPDEMEAISKMLRSSEVVHEEAVQAFKRLNPKQEGQW